MALFNRIVLLKTKVEYKVSLKDYFVVFNILFFKNLEFVSLIKALVQNYELHGRKFFTSLVDQMYKENVELMQAKLKKADYVSLTSDLWTDVNNLSFITITCHCIIEFKLLDLVLSTRSIGDAAHTGPNLNAIFRVIFIFRSRVTFKDLNLKIFKSYLI